jgi:hypothetical protein
MDIKEDPGQARDGGAATKRLRSDAAHLAAFHWPLHTPARKPHSPHATNKDPMADPTPVLDIEQWSRETRGPLPRADTDAAAGFDILDSFERFNQR